MNSINVALKLFIQQWNKVIKIQKNLEAKNKLLVQFKHTAHKSQVLTFHGLVLSTLFYSSLVFIWLCNTGFNILVNCLEYFHLIPWIVESKH